MREYLISDGDEFVAEDARTGETYPTPIINKAKWFATAERATQFLNEDCWQMLGKFYVYAVEYEIEKAGP